MNDSMYAKPCLCVHLCVQYAHEKEVENVERMMSEWLDKRNEK